MNFSEAGKKWKMEKMENIFFLQWKKVENIKSGKKWKMEKSGKLFNLF